MSLRTAIDYAVVSGHRDRLPAIESAFNTDLDEARAEVRAACERARALESEARAELQRLRQALHDEDSHVTLADVREAEEHLRVCQLYRQEVDEQCQVALKRFEAIELAGRKAYRDARAELDAVMPLYRKYAAIAYSASGTTTAAGAHGATPATGGGASSKSQSTPPLPGGMKWIALADLDWSSVPPNLQFKKAAADEIETMMARFDREIVPLMSDPGGVSRDQLVQIDLMRGTTDPSQSLAFAWDCMIGGGDVIALDAPHPLTGPQYGWTSGRHRALVARNLGWTHIPAKVI